MGYPRLRLPTWLHGNVAWLIAGQSMRAFTLAVLGVAVPLYAAAAGYSTLRVGYLLTAGSLGTAAIMLFVGLYSDRYGRRRMLLWLAVAATVGSAVLALTTQLWPLIGAVALTAIGSGPSAGSSGGAGPTGPPTQALLADSCRAEERTPVFTALFFLGVSAGTFGALAAELPSMPAARLLGGGPLTAFHALFWLAAAGSAAGIPLTLALREAARPAAAQGGPSRAALGLIGRLWLTNSVNGISWGIMGPFLTYWFHLRYGVGAGQLGGLYALANVLVAVAAYGGLPLARRVGIVRAVVASRLAVAAAIGGMIFAPSFALAGAGFLLRLAFGAVTVPLRQSFVMGVTEERSRSAVAAFGSLPSQVTSSLTPSLAAYLVEAAGFEAPLVVAAVTQLMNAAMYFGLFNALTPPEERGRRGTAAATASPAGGGASAGVAEQAGPSPR